MYINIQSIIRISCHNISDDVYAFLKQQLGHFFTDIKDDTEKSDIAIYCLNKPPILQKTMSRWDTLFSFYISEYKDHKALILNHKDKPDIIITFSKVINIYYIKRSKIERKLYAHLLFCINIVLKGKKGLLFHGAAATLNNNVVVLTGHRGTKKTLLLLEMLKEGWGFISDDKAILHNNKFHLFQPFIPIREHHMEALPWISEIVSLRKDFIKKSDWKKKLLKISRKYLNKHLLPALDRFFNSLISIDPTIISNKRVVRNSSTPLTFFILSSGVTYKMKALTVVEALDKISAIQKLAFNEFDRIEYILRLYNMIPTFDEKEIVETNILNKNYFSITAPEDFPVNLLYTKVLTCLQ